VINAFDQWGVELVKEIGGQIFGVMSGQPEETELDPATESLIARWQEAQ
jgi:glucose-6-phosphate isomerase